MEIPCYIIHSVLGKGGMATVYLATQESLERKIALKVMRPQAEGDESMCERFVKEGKIIAKLEHPNIVTIYDIGIYESKYYMSMEYCSAPNLKDRIHSPEGAQNPLEILRQITSALCTAHAHGFIHRDVKPANILFRDDNTPVLTDFGIAKAMQAETQLTAMGWTVGTPEYMGPEQATGKPVDARADLYSLGVVFYEMLAGHKPYVGSDAFTTALMHVNEPIPRLPENCLKFQPIVDRLMAKNPDERFQTGEEVLAEIDTHTAITAPTTRVMPHFKQDASGPQTVVESKSASHGLLWKSMAVLSAVSVIGVAAFFVIDTDTSGPAPVEPTEVRRQPLDSTLQEKVDRLLEIAAVHTEIGRVREPIGSNAYEAYQMVLEIDPGNPEASSAIASIEASDK